MPHTAGWGNSDLRRRNLFLTWRKTQNSTVKVIPVKFLLCLCYVCPAAGCVSTASGVAFEASPICLAWLGASRDATVLTEMSAPLEKQARLGTHAERQPPAASHWPVSLVLAGWRVAEHLGARSNAASSSSVSCAPSLRLADVIQTRFQAHSCAVYFPQKRWVVSRDG